jgi:hypothetical protein
VPLSPRQSLAAVRLNATKTNLRVQMNYIVVGAIVVWFGGMFFLVGLILNDIRLIYNNIDPAAQSAGPAPVRDRWLGRVLDAVPFDGQGLGFAAFMLVINRFIDLDRFGDTRITKVDPALLTEAGAVHLRKARRHEWIALVWMITGVILMVWASP